MNNKTLPIDMDLTSLASLEPVIFRALRRLQQAGEVHAKRLARFGGLTPMQLLILQALANENRLTASTLSGRVSLTQATLSGLLDRLEELGLLMRQRDEVDRRRQWLLLSEAGAALLKEAPSLLPPALHTALGALPDWERHNLTAALLRVAELCSELDG